MAEAKEKMTIVLEKRIIDSLKDYAYEEDIRSKNWAVTEIVTDFIEEWLERR